jgi:hypothetical protein
MTYDRVDIPAEVVPRAAEPLIQHLVDTYASETNKTASNWRRVLHSAHHRTQLTVYLRLLKRAVLPSYGPTADVSWSRADPPLTVRSAERGRPR